MTKTERKSLCEKCSNTQEKPFFISGLGETCEECGKSAKGEYELRNGVWRSFATYR